MTSIQKSTMKTHLRFVVAFQQCPLIAILRGVTPDTAAAHGHALYDAGFRVIEVPLNSPQPFDSIAEIRQAIPSDAIVGAGTVLDVDAIERVRSAGGELIVMPHCAPDVIRETKALGLACAPGVATPTEAFLALKSGADALKLFPAEQLGPDTVKAWRAVIPTEVPLVPVGGITPDNMELFLSKGASGFGLGSALYSPGQTAADTASRASAYVRGLAAAKMKC
jgi:2-dehydro-3-deoxyphosphogalactonate aldolase